jgi:ribose/xylose/arabinose/galactoside ABC-type transport system permease subunit
VENRGEGTMNKIVKTYVPILLGGMLTIHWWWSSFNPFIESSIPMFFIAHLLLVLGIWFLIPQTKYGRRIALLVGSLFVLYSVFMAALLIPGGFEEIGLFAIIIPVYLAALGVILGMCTYTRVPYF